MKAAHRQRHKPRNNAKPQQHGRTHTTGSTLAKTGMAAKTRAVIIAVVAIIAALAAVALANSHFSSQANASVKRSPSNTANSKSNNNNMNINNNVKPDNRQSHQPKPQVSSHTGDASKKSSKKSSKPSNKKPVTAAQKMDPSKATENWQLAQKFANEGKYEQSIEIYQQFMDTFPDVKEIYYALATVLSMNGDYSNAMNVFTEGMEKFPSDFQIHIRYCRLLASLLNFRGNSPIYKLTKQDVMDVCLKAVHLAPKDDGEPLATVGAVLTLIAEYERAASVLSEWITQFGSTKPLSDVLQVKQNLALTYIRSGAYKKAWETTREILEDDDNISHKVLSAAANIRSVAWPLDKLAWKYSGESLNKFVETLQIKHPEICPTGRWKLSLNYSREAVNNPDKLKVTLLNPDSAYKPYGDQNDPVFVGPTQDEYPRFYHERYINLIYHQDVFLAGSSAVLHSDCILHAGSHYTNVDVQSFPHENTGIQTIEIDYPVASIIQHQMANYYHWLMESLPKLLFLKQHLLDNPESSNIKLLVPQRGFSNIIDATLDLAEFASLSDRLVRFTEIPHQTRYHFKKGLYVVDWIHPEEDTFHSLVDNVWSVYSPPQEAILRTRDFFHNVMRDRGLFPSGSENSLNGKGTIVYISRPPGKAVRSIPNESAFIESLKNRFGDRLVVHTGKESLLNQASLFAHADIVVGSHGAGLTNMLFTRPGTPLVMLPMEPHVEFCFGHLVAALGRRHWIVSEVGGSYYYGNYKALSERDMKVIEDTVVSALEATGRLGSIDHDEL